MLSLNDAAEQLAPLIYAFVDLHRRTPDDDAMRGYINHVIYDMCRQMERFCEPKVSEAAHEAALARDLHDVESWRWRDQKRHDPARQTFHLEHKMPVSSIRERVLAAKSVSEAADALRSSCTAWILKEEDRELTRLGFARRREDPDEAYRLAGIVLRDGSI